MNFEDKILIIGGSGFVGYHLIKKLLKSGKSVSVLARPSSNLKDLVSLGTHVLYGDVKDKKSLIKAFQGFHTVVNLAVSHAGHEMSVLKETNIDGVQNVLEAALETPSLKHLIHYSSMGVYGEGHNLDEKSEQKPHDNYGLSRKMAEDLIQDFKKKHESLPFKVSIIRPSYIYGPGGATHLTKLFQQISKGRYAIIGSGKNHMNVIYIDDLIDATVSLMEHSEAWGEDYIITDNQAYTLTELSNIVAKVCGKKPVPKIPYWFAYLSGFGFDVISKITGKEFPLNRVRVRNMVRNKVLSSRKAKQKIGYEAKHPFSEGAKKAYSWYKEQGLVE